MSVPALVQEALQARLDRLGPETREVLSTASVVGRSFGMPLLERLLPREQLLPALSELQRFELVVEERRRPAPEYRFRHGLLQEAAYESLVEQGRRDLHLRVGQALEELHRESLEEVYGLLALHFSEADDAERAVDYLLKAGDGARALFSDEEALNHYSRALDFLDRLGDHARARETLFKVALAHHLAFDFEAANRAYQDAFSRPAEEPEPVELNTEIEIAGPAIEVVVPGYAYTSQDIEATDLLFRGLLRLAPGQNVVPELAETFSVSNDGRTYRFRLREDARWSDGEPVTAHDFVFAWDRMRAERVPATIAIDDLETYEAEDDRTLRVTLREPRSYFPYLASFTALCPWPRHKVEELGDDWRDPGNLIGNGPFVLGELAEGHLRVVADPRWPRPRGNVREIRFSYRVGGRSGTRLEEWRAGRYDVTTVEQASALEDTGGRQELGLTTYFLAFNTRVEPFADERVRRAFAHAVDRERLVAATPNVDQPAVRSGILPPGMPGHSHQVALGYEPDRARELLAEAGFPGGEGLPELDVPIPLFWTHREGRAAELVAQFGAIGARVRVMSLTGRESRAALDAGAPMWIGGWTADYPDPDGFVRALVEHHPELYSDEEVLDLLAGARSSRDQAERIRLYRQLERLWIHDRAAIVPILYPRWILLTRPWVEGLWLSSLRRGPFDEVTVRR